MIRGLGPTRVWMGVHSTGARVIIQSRHRASHYRKTLAKIRKIIPTIGAPLDDDRLLSLKDKNIAKLFLSIKDNAEFPRMINNEEFEAKLYTFSQRSCLTDIENYDFLKPAFTIITNPGLFPDNFSKLSSRGKLLVNLFVLDNIYAKHPNLGPKLSETVLEAYTSDAALADVAKILGISQTLMISDGWRFAYSSDKKLLDDICIRSLEAVIGALYVNHGAVRAYKFVKDHILSRRVNTYEFILDQNPTATLIALFAVKKRELPVSRIIAETGRKSNDPVFVVGVYSGSEKLAEASGHSIHVAEDRACREILRTHYFEECNDVIPGNYALIEENMDKNLSEAETCSKHVLKAEG